jgi:hypothetical protein
VPLNDDKNEYSSLDPRRSLQGKRKSESIVIFVPEEKKDDGEEEQEKPEGDRDEEREKPDLLKIATSVWDLMTRIWGG